MSTTSQAGITTLAGQLAAEIGALPYPERMRALASALRVLAAAAEEAQPALEDVANDCDFYAKEADERDEQAIAEHAYWMRVSSRYRRMDAGEM